MHSLISAAKSMGREKRKKIDGSSEKRGSRDDAVVRALTSHQCGPGSTPGPGVICGLSLLLVLFLAPRGFPLSSKTNTSKFQLDLECTNMFKRASELLSVSWVN